MPFFQPGHCPDQENDESGENKKLRQFGLCPDRHYCEQRENRPEQRVVLVSAAGQLVGCYRYDSDNGCADCVEECLHPP